MKTLIDVINEWVSGEGRSLSVRDYIDQLDQAREELEMLLEAAKSDEET